MIGTKKDLISTKKDMIGTENDMIGTKKDLIGAVLKNTPPPNNCDHGSIIWGGSF